MGQKELGVFPTHQVNALNKNIDKNQEYYANQVDQGKNTIKTNYQSSDKGIQKLIKRHEEKEELANA